MEKENKSALQTSLKLVVKTSFIVLVGIFISKLLTFAYRVIVARSFGDNGPEIYGLFSLAMIISSFFVSIFSLGLQEGLLRYIPFFNGKKEVAKSHYVFRVTVLIHLIIGVLAGLFMFLVSDFLSAYIFHNTTLSIYLKWFALFVPVSLVSATFHIITRAYEKIAWNSFIGNILQPLIKIILLFILIFIGLKYIAVIFSYNLGFVVVLIASFLVCFYKIPELFKKAEIDKKSKSRTLKELFSYSWPLMFLGIVMFIFYGIDSFIIGYFLDVESVGIYNAAVPIASLIGVAPILFIQIFFPMISREYGKRNIKLIKDLSKQVGKWIFILNLPFLIILLLFPGAVINILFGPEYLDAEISLRFLSIGVFFYALFNVSERLLSMAGKSKAVLFNLLIAAIINLVLNLTLVSKYGINGVAFATMFTYFVWSLISLIQAKHYVSIIPLKRKMFWVFFSGAIPALLLLYTKQFLPSNLLMFILEALFFLLFYILLILLTKSLDENDLMILKSIKNKIRI